MPRVAKSVNVQHSGRWGPHNLASRSATNPATLPWFAGSRRLANRSSSAAREDKPAPRQQRLDSLRLANGAQACGKRFRQAYFLAGLNNLRGHAMREAASE